MGRPLRVAILSVHTCPLAVMGGKKTGGMNVYVRELAKSLSKLNIEVDVFTRLQDKCQAEISHTLGSGIRVIHIPAGPMQPLPPNQIVEYIDDFAANMVRFAEKENTSPSYKYDLIHSHYWISGLVAECIQKIWNREIPTIQMFHTLGLLKQQQASDKENPALLFRIKKEKHIIKHVANTFIAATSSEKTQLLELYNADTEKIKIIPPGVDLSIFKPQDQKQARKNIQVHCEQKLILFAGRIEPLKGIDTLLRAVGILQQQAPETVASKCLLIVGGNPWEEDPQSEMYRLQKMSKDLNIKKQVDFVGAKDQRTLPSYYAAADVIVMPSHYESFGMVALEAMASGRPVIASEVGGLAQLIQNEHNGLHVQSRDPEALAAALEKILSDDTYHAQLANQAHKDALDYSWENIAEKIASVYKQAVSTACSSC